jgi:hypothetical protein
VNVVGLTLTAVGLVGVGSILGWAARVRELTRSQRFLRLCRKEALDVVLTTATASADVHPSRVPDDRLHAQLGYLRATTVIGQFVAATGTRKLLNVQISDDVTLASLSHDAVLLGGTSGNRVAAEFVEQVGRATGVTVAYDENDERRNVMAVGDRQVEYDWKTEAGWKAVERDFGLIVLWRNPFTEARRRVLYVAGFTPAGTLAATRYLVHHHRELRREAGRTITGARARLAFERRPSLAAIVEIEFMDAGSANVSIHHALVLPGS